ncbi:hypothetical protein [Actinomycetospora sp. CA-084318]|uniref:hypothetical protein n=1 Tax=Actinomycetospora sp. CA-084318 TaxID=3239892 RepID=UPI003D9931DC
MTDDEYLRAVRDEAHRRYTAPPFVHATWYWRYHILIVERIAMELLDLHPDADTRSVMLLVWLHDIGKTTGVADTRAETKILAADIIERHGLGSEYSRRFVAVVAVLDAKENLPQSRLEVQIASSADGCSHLVGPFLSIYWQENHREPVEDLLAENRRKIEVAWEKKIVLPEARRAFFSRYQRALESAGALPLRLLGGD